MAWTNIQDPVCSNYTQGAAVAAMSTAAPGTATTAGNSLICYIYGYEFGVSCTLAVTDSAGNTWVVDQLKASNVGSMSVAIASTHNAAAIPTSTGWVKVTLTGATSPVFWGFFVDEFNAGGGVGSYDTGAVGTDAATNPPTSGASGTASGGAELVVGASAFHQSPGPWTASVATWTGLYTLTDSTNFMFRAAYEAVTGSGTYTNNVITANGTVLSAIAAVAVYKISAAPVARPQYIQYAPKRASFI